MTVRTWIALAAAACAPALAQAQQALPIEFGVDAGISVTDTDPTLTTISVPVSSLRVGFYVTERVAIEPALSFNYAKAGSGSGSILAPELGVVFDFTASRQAPQLYLRPFLGLVRTSVDGGDFVPGGSQTVTHAGAGLGAKIPFGSIERFAWRMEALYDHGFENEDKLVASENSFGLRLGLSFFTK